jgi:hypothetical protein
MLIYLWFRFELIYGVAAVVAVFHDTLITVGFFALTDQRDQPDGHRGDPHARRLLHERHYRGLRPYPREPAPRRRESLPAVVNRSINQTLSRTVLTSGLTFLTVLALYIFGGQVLEWLLLRACRRHFDRHLFLYRRGRSHAGGVSGLARQQRQERGAASGQEEQVGCLDELKAVSDACANLHSFCSMFCRCTVVLIQG